MTSSTISTPPTWTSRYHHCRRPLHSPPHPRPTRSCCLQLHSRQHGRPPQCHPLGHPSPSCPATIDSSTKLCHSHRISRRKAQSGTYSTLTNIQHRGTDQRPQRKDQNLSYLPMESRRAHHQTPNANIHPRPQQDGSHDAGCVDQDQE
jgi:hypothetical protein